VSRDGEVAWIILRILVNPAAILATTDFKGPSAVSSRAAVDN
jgi:hypothetical protein